LITFLPVFLQVVRGATLSTTGFVLVPLTIGTGAGSLVTGRLVSKTGQTMVFPIVGLAGATVTLVAFALFGSELGLTAIATLLFVNGLFMGTVMGVVQVVVQAAAGPTQLGEAAASVQFSRSLGPALGTALVATMLFAVLAMRNPQALHAFAAMIEHGQAGTVPPPAIASDIRTAFRIAFLAIPVFTTGGFLLALTNPSRRI
jgi:MFS family permease